MASLDIKQILCPVDLSEKSKYALRYAVGIAEKFNSSINVVHIIPHIAYSRTSYYDVDDKTDLAKLCTNEIPKGVDFKSEIIKNDDIDDGIDDYARSNKVNLIVICTHGRSLLGKLVHGSTTDEVTAKAPCPVVIVHEDDE